MSAASPRRGWITAFGIWGAPLAWFVQLCAGYALFALPCYPGPERNQALPPQAGWIWPAGIILYIACLAIGGAATLTAWRLFRASIDASDGSPEFTGPGRSRFLAYWAVVLGAGFTILLVADLVGFVMVPPCAL